MLVVGIKSKRLESKGCGQSLMAKVRVKGSSWKRMADVSASKNNDWQSSYLKQKRSRCGEGWRK